MPDAALCTAAQVKARARISGTDNDALIALLVPVATRRLCQAAGREFMPQATATRRFDVDRHLVPLPGMDLRSAAAVTLHPESEGEAVVLTAGTHYELAMDAETGTAGMVRLAYGLSLWSTRAANFGRAQLEIAGAWGIWANVDAVPAEVNAAAQIFVISGIDRALADGLAVGDLTSGAGMAHFTSSWDIPAPAWRAVQSYSRELGVW